ncbi:sirohydrochlorin chelatase [Corynebacterium afermentans subsp. lipophilum]|uniref:sirohydrochlorin chelatase n=1 Tax=Corynebacterium afermentans TaxID=38286 RepID=UPI00188AEADF|nr:CbiX/SirB N-terminal domain-containing protein [Corynebacterium afermentans]MBF4548014.1 sirohydrochlorin chelatase [Corynebacterium afermentans subsp. lipophilum]WJY59714.1 Sirohydrochlorin cobaltochelatase [Corynebacterium afermentans subsp. lipophilum]
MTALITLSHGSRHPRAKEGIRALTEAAADTLGVEWVDAHLEFDRPTLAEAAAALSSPRAIVVPLLFTRAFHAKVDVPAHLAEAREHCDLTLAEPLGTGPDIAEALHKRLRIDAPSASHATVFPVGTSDAEQAANYVRLADDLARLAGVDVSVVQATRGDRRFVDKHTHVLPLFVTHGTLLDRIPPHLSASGPLTTDLADVVANRYRTAEKDA